MNSQFLIEQRQAWWDEIELLWQQHLADDLSLPDLAAVDLIPGRVGTGKLSPFFSLTRQFFGVIAEQVLQQHAAELTPRNTALGEERGVSCELGQLSRVP